MPTYEYICDACKHEFEEFQSITAKPLRKCPKCGKARLKRLIGIGAGVIFKGSGFYETDYRSDSYQKGAKAEKDGATAKKDAPADKAAPGAKTPGNTEKTTPAVAAKSNGAAEKPASAPTRSKRKSDK